MRSRSERRHGLDGNVIGTPTRPLHWEFGKPRHYFHIISDEADLVDCIGLSAQEAATLASHRVNPIPLKRGWKVRPYTDKEDHVDRTNAKKIVAFTKRYNTSVFKGELGSFTIFRVEKIKR